jgi:hypothetical protein
LSHRSACSTRQIGLGYLNPGSARTHDFVGWRYLLAGEAGGLVLSELMPEAAPLGGLAMPDEPEGVLVSAGGVDGAVDGELMGADLEASSTFLPQAPSANNAESARTVAAGLNWNEFMRFPF